MQKKCIHLQIAFLIFEFLSFLVLIQTNAVFAHGDIFHKSETLNAVSLISTKGDQFLANRTLIFGILILGGVTLAWLLIRRFALDVRSIRPSLRLVQELGTAFVFASCIGVVALLFWSQHAF